ncbi:MAG: flavodoxin [Prevotella sp.]|jgi:flavodoxin
MRRISTLLLAAFALLALSACAQSKSQKKETMNQEKKILVAFFSRADENYNVGYIKKGNTQVLAEMIAKEVGADTFHIVTVNPYPAAYQPCIEQAQKELQANARPEIKGDAKVEDYDVIFLGYPNWWGEPPMAIFTFMEKHDWNGKTVIPFCTHEGSGLGATVESLKEHAKGATFLNGLAIRGTDAQHASPDVKKRVTEWLSSLKY